MDSTGHNTGDFNCCRSWLGVLCFLNSVETNILAKESAQAPPDSEAGTGAKYCCEALTIAPASSLALPLRQKAGGAIGSDHALKEDHFKNPSPAKQRSSGCSLSELGGHPLSVCVC